MKEILKLKEMIEEANLPFEYVYRNLNNSYCLVEHHHIAYPKESIRKFSFVEDTSGQGTIEMVAVGNGQLGFRRVHLTAEDAFKIISEYHNEHSEELGFLPKGAKIAKSEE